MADFLFTGPDGVDRHHNRCAPCQLFGRNLQKVKKCTLCGEVKDIGEFVYKSPVAYERLFRNTDLDRIRTHSTCTTCRPVAWKAWYANWILQEAVIVDRTPRPLKANRMRSAELAKFEAKFTKTDTCWLWKGALNAGYGAFSYRGKTIGAHRVSYRHWIGTPPKGLHLDHLCGVRNCVNPWHLQPVTPRENIRRGSKNRSITKQFIPSVSFI
jgi:hypothetical protein